MSDPAQGPGAAPGRRPRVAFLFNHDQIHQVAHGLPIALELARQAPGLDIAVATTGPHLTAEVRRLAARAGGPLPALTELGPSLRTRALDALLGRVLPVRKLLAYADNLGFFRSLDMLVVPEKTSLLLKTRYRLDRPAIVHTRHGAGDRALGFDRASAGFDHVLCSGTKYRDRLVAEAGLDPARVSMVGYPKFDLPVPAWPLPPGFDPARPTVLYSPHPSPHLSSWYRHGRAVLEFFRQSRDYQLIFAPHVMLFQRPFVLTVDRLRLARPGRVPRFARMAPNIHVDTGSPASADMTYTEAAGIWLGDASSQVYEFLRRPRPCLFLNSHGVRWQGDPNYLHFRAGEVIENPDDLREGLARTIARHAALYRPVQEQIFARTFDLTEEPSSARAAREILRLLALRAP